MTRRVLIGIVILVVLILILAAVAMNTLAPAD